jgi:hypothetical protein
LQPVVQVRLSARHLLSGGCRFLKAKPASVYGLVLGGGGGLGGGDRLGGGAAVVGLAAAAWSAGEGLGRRWCGRCSGGFGVGAGEGGRRESGRWVGDGQLDPSGGDSHGEDTQGASSAARATGSADTVMVPRSVVPAVFGCPSAAGRDTAPGPVARSRPRACRRPPSPSRPPQRSLLTRPHLAPTRRRSNCTCVVWEVLPDLGARTRRRSPLVARGGDQAMALPVVDLPSGPGSLWGDSGGPGAAATIKVVVPSPSSS